MSDTAISNIDKINIGIDEAIMLLKDNSAKFLSNSISRCPATMLAVNRTDKVMGRMMLLTISMANMKLIRGNGVPMGIVWISMCFVMKFQAKIMIRNHIDIAKENEMVMWAVGVKIKGNRAIKFKMKMNEKTALMKFIIPLGALVINVFISLLIFSSKMYFLFKENLDFMITITGKKTANHSEFIRDEEGSKIEKRFVINFKII